MIIFRFKMLIFSDLCLLLIFRFVERIKKKINAKKQFYTNIEILQ